MIETEKRETEVIPVIMKGKLKACPRCGKTGRGLYFHVRNCKA